MLSSTIHIFRSALLNYIKNSLQDCDVTTHWMNHITKEDGLKKFWIISNFRIAKLLISDFFQCNSFPFVKITFFPKACIRFLTQIRLYVTEIEKVVSHYPEPCVCHLKFWKSFWGWQFPMIFDLRQNLEVLLHYSDRESTPLGPFN